MVQNMRRQRLLLASLIALALAAMLGLTAPSVSYAGPYTGSDMGTESFPSECEVKHCQCGW